jgi:hypothetical protein
VTLELRPREITVKTMAGRAFDQDTARVKRACALLPGAENERVTDKRHSIIEALAMSETEDIDFEALQMPGFYSGPAEFDE